jgi:hypothetical protein
MTILTQRDAVARVMSEMFDKPLLNNNIRGLLVEAMIASVLHPQWTWCSADYAAWDFESEDGVWLEVKQSAARQSWAPETGGASAPRFDIRERTCRWVGPKKI